MSIIKLDHIPDIKLIAFDMDGTLLDADSNIHDDFWPLASILQKKGITLCPASGRQYHCLVDKFKELASSLFFVAENGACVVANGVKYSTKKLAVNEVLNLLLTARMLQSTHKSVGVVLSGTDTAYIEHPTINTDSNFRIEVDKSYKKVCVVEDLTKVEDSFFKVAIFNHKNSEHVSAPMFEKFKDQYQVLVSGENWLDIMSLSANKGAGIKSVQQILNITPAQTMAFGDYLNDLEMMDTANYSFAMENAHPLLKERANYISPENTKNGVIRTIKSVLKLK